MTLAQQLKRVEQKNAELAAQLQLREQLNLSLIKDLSVEKEDLEREANRLLARLEQERAKRESLETEYQRLKAEFAEKTTLMREEIAFLKAQFYGRSSEKSSADVSADQVMLFNEVEVLAAIAAAEGCQSAPIRIPAHERKRHGGKLIPADFPREEVAHDLDEAEKFCAHDGTPLKPMGADEALRYHFKKPELIVKVHKRLKYSCPKCRQCVKIAPLAAHILLKSQAEPSLLANITVAKYVDGLPLNRQSGQLARLGLDLGADTMATWLNTIGVERLPPLIHLMHEAVLNEPYLHFDDTTVQVLKSDRAPTADHYMFVLAAGPPGRRMVLYMYASTRNATILKLLLSGPNGPYRGKAVCDDLKLHDLLVEDPAFEGLKLFGCLTHCRRYYDRADKVTELPSQQSLARVAIKTYLGKVFYIERQIEEQRAAFERSGGTWDLAQTLKIRQERSKPIMLAFKQWVDELAPGVPPKSALGKALGYTISQWEKLRRFLDDPEVPAHNNRVENDIRPFAVGRRAWLFMDTQIGARASANLFTLAQTCRANGIAPVNYFEHLYERLPHAKTMTDLEALLPWNYKRLLKAAS